MKYLAILWRRWPNLIIDDRWIGAISSEIWFIRNVLYRGEHSQIDKYTIEHINTDSGYKNVTYNHSIYQSGIDKELPIEKQMLILIQHP